MARPYGTNELTTGLSRDRVITPLLLDYSRPVSIPLVSRYLSLDSFSLGILLATFFLLPDTTARILLVTLTRG